MKQSLVCVSTLPSVPLFTTSARSGTKRRKLFFKVQKRDKRVNKSSDVVPVSRLVVLQSTAMWSLTVFVLFLSWPSSDSELSGSEKIFSY